MSEENFKHVASFFDNSCTNAISDLRKSDKSLFRKLDLHTFVTIADIV